MDVSGKRQCVCTIPMKGVSSVFSEFFDHSCQGAFVMVNKFITINKNLMLEMSSLITRNIELRNILKTWQLPSVHLKRQQCLYGIFLSIFYFEVISKLHKY